VVKNYFPVVYPAFLNFHSSSEIVARAKEQYNLTRSIATSEMLLFDVSFAIFGVS